MNKSSWLIVLLTLTIGIRSKLIYARDCPCSSAEYCQTFNYNKQEVFGYVLKSTEDVWKNFDWTKLTTISLIDFYDEKLMCLAHKNHVRVLTRENISVEVLKNESFVNNWIEERVQFATDKFLNGINLFIDDPVSEKSPYKTLITNFVHSVANKFYKNINNSIVVFNVPWSPINKKNQAVDGKNYDFAAISKTVDQLFVMDYDQLSQTFDGPCVAGAISNYYYTLGGLEAYRKYNVDLNKLILGTPFYADNYGCIDYQQNMRCITESFIFRGSNCSSHSANKIPLNELKNFINRQRHIYSRDENSSENLYVYLNSTYGMAHQIWFEDTSSTQKKYLLAEQMKLRGVGMWTLNWLTPDMWKIVPKFKSIR